MPAAGGVTPIVPLVIGDAARAMACCEEALRRGVFAQAIRPPTVPPGTSRLRLTVMATHSPEELRAAASAVAEAMRSVDGARAPSPEGDTAATGAQRSPERPADDPAAHGRPARSADPTAGAHRPPERTDDPAVHRHPERHDEALSVSRAA